MALSTVLEIVRGTLDLIFASFAVGGLAAFAFLIYRKRVRIFFREVFLFFPKFDEQRIRHTLAKVDANIKPRLAWRFSWDTFLCFSSVTHESIRDCAEKTNAGKR